VFITANGEFRNFIEEFIMSEQNEPLVVGCPPSTHLELWWLARGQLSISKLFVQIRFGNLQIAEEP
jgi:hypothetical protein